MTEGNKKQDNAPIEARRPNISSFQILQSDADRREAPSADKTRQQSASSGLEPKGETTQRYKWAFPVQYLFRFLTSSVEQHRYFLRGLEEAITTENSSFSDNIEKTEFQLADLVRVHIQKREAKLLLDALKINSLVKPLIN